MNYIINPINGKGCSINSNEGLIILKNYIQNYKNGGMKFNPFNVSEADMEKTNFLLKPIGSSDSESDYEEVDVDAATPETTAPLPPPPPRPVSPFKADLIRAGVVDHPYPYFEEYPSHPSYGKTVEIDFSKDPILPPPTPDKTLESVIKENAYDRRLWEIRYRILERRLNNDPKYELNREQLDFLNWYLGPYDRTNPFGQTNREYFIEIDRKHRGIPPPPPEAIQPDSDVEDDVEDLMFDIELSGGSRNYVPNSYALFYEIKESDFADLDVRDKIFLLNL